MLKVIILNNWHVTKHDRQHRVNIKLFKLSILNILMKLNQVSRRGMEYIECALLIEIFASSVEIIHIFRVLVFT